MANGAPRQYLLPAPKGMSHPSFLPSSVRNRSGRKRDESSDPSHRGSWLDMYLCVYDRKRVFVWCACERAWPARVTESRPGMMRRFRANLLSPLPLSLSLSLSLYVCITHVSGTISCCPASTL